MANIDIKEQGDSIIFEVRVIPRSSKTEIVGEYNGALKVKIMAPPVEGAANEELLRVLSKELGLARADVEILSGQFSRTKRIRAHGAAAAKIIAILKPKS